MDINFLLSIFDENEVQDIVRIYVNRALFTDDAGDNFEAIKLLEDLYKAEMEKNQ